MKNHKINAKYRKIQDMQSIPKREEREEKKFRLVHLPSQTIHKHFHFEEILMKIECKDFTILIVE